MVPISGGQYRFVTAFAPEESERLLSYCSGWVCSIGWQARFTLHCYVITNLIQSLAQPDMAATRWQTHLLMILVALVMSCFNAFAADHLTIAEGVCLRSLNKTRAYANVDSCCSFPQSATSLCWYPFSSHFGFWQLQRSRRRTSSFPSRTTAETIDGRLLCFLFLSDSFPAYSRCLAAMLWHTLQRR